MRDLELAGYPTIDPRPLAAGAYRFRLSRVAFAVSVFVHVAAGYALSRHEWPAPLPPPSLVAEFMPVARLPPPAAAPAPEPNVVEERAVAPEIAVPRPDPREQPQPTP